MRIWTIIDKKEKEKEKRKIIFRHGESNPAPMDENHVS